jgi:hypothetical protein
VLTTPISGSETLESMIGTATVRTDRCVMGDWTVVDMASVALIAAPSQAGGHESAATLQGLVRNPRLGAPRPPAGRAETCQARESVLLISPTGGGKTLAGFLPSLIEITGTGEGGTQRHPHALYLAAEGACR